MRWPSASRRSVAVVAEKPVVTRLGALLRAEQAKGPLPAVMHLTVGWEVFIELHKLDPEDFAPLEKMLGYRHTETFVHVNREDVNHMALSREAP